MHGIGMKQETALLDVRLEDRYRLDQGQVLLNGSQALVKLLLLRRELDAAAGLNTAGYVSGYRGSPLGGVDQALWKATAALEDANVVFEPGVNEDLAATAVWGTQQLENIGEATVDGVFALWYGKGPGVDRSGDPIKHGNYAGAHPKGGVLAVFGDDHPGKSSTIAHHSEQAMAANGVPVLYPSTVQEILHYGVAGFELSRYSGCWCGLKLVNETVEQTATVDVRLAAAPLVQPERSDLLPPEGVHFRGTFSPQRDESILMNHRLPLVHRFARANALDKVIVGNGSTAALGIVTAGKACQDVLEALALLGIDDARATELGVAVYKVGLIWPIEPDGLREFAQGKRELFFVEEKDAFLEKQAAALLYNLAQRPSITGKSDLEGRHLLAADLQLEPAHVAEALARRIAGQIELPPEVRERASALAPKGAGAFAILTADERRTPYFCSGCPHNTSTQVPEGSLALAGIGCHGMAVMHKPRTLHSVHMGGEGLNWVGAHRFTRRKHVFQNLGDGTYFHSGLMAIRAAAASGANITYKILYNDAVAMTGGQPVDGPISLPSIARQLIAEGVREVHVVSENPQPWRGAGLLPPTVQVHAREMLESVQKELREREGCTAIIYEQTCAAEKRRRRKRGRLAEPDKRLWINPAVCEGCGDCSEQSSCISIEPLTTELGTKRAINQEACNKDYSCAQGFCPSFVGVHGAALKRGGSVPVAADTLAALPLPAQPELGERPMSILLAGVGGTGVVTVAAVIAMAAHLEKKSASTYDMTGLAQKNGAVYSHVRISAPGAAIASQRIGIGQADLVLAFDTLAGLGEDGWRTLDARRSHFIGNDAVVPTAAFAKEQRLPPAASILQQRVRRKLGDERSTFVDAAELSRRFCGDPLGANMLLLGVAVQHGLVPVSVAAIQRAIELNAVAVELNQRAFAVGRLWAHDPQALQVAAPGAGESAPRALSLHETIEAGKVHLTAYQGVPYARQYERLVRRVAAAEALAQPGSAEIAEAAALHLRRLMAYKDEYEVARLHTAPQMRESLQALFSPGYRLTLHLAPPMFSRRDPATGHLRKREFGRWIFPALKLMAKLKGVRGTVWDVFGYTRERRAERALRDQYVDDLEAIVARLGAGNHVEALALARWPGIVRGFGHVKERNMQAAQEERERLLSGFMNVQPTSATPGEEQPLRCAP